MKALPEKRKSPSYPGDPNTDTVDSGSNPFSDWPWDQSLQLGPDLPYRRAGRLMHNLLRWCNQHCTCAVMKMTFDLRTRTADVLFEKFTTAIAGGPSQHGHALLFAMQVVGEAKEQMQCILANAQLRTIQYSCSAMLSYVARRREAQSVELQVFLTEVSTRITAASTCVKATHGGATAAWIDLFTAGCPTVTLIWLSQLPWRPPTRHSKPPLYQDLSPRPRPRPEQAHPSRGSPLPPDKAAAAAAAAVAAQDS
jgi:hypothetical protein